MLRKIFATLIVALSIAIIGTATVDARGRHGRLIPHGHDFRHKHVSLDRVLSETDLTDEQRAEIDAKVEELSAAEAPKDEIRGAVVDLLDGFGVEVPSILKSRLARQLDKFDLTDEQQAAVDAKIAELEAAGATKEETRDAVVDLLEELGVEVPTYLRGHVDRMLAQFNLTDEQHDELATLVDELKEGDATKTEIRDAIQQWLEDMGIEIPEDFFGKRGRHRGKRLSFFLFDLTEEQRLQLVVVVTELKDNGADRGEVHGAIKDLLVEWDIIEGQADGEVVEGGDDDAAANLAMIDAQIQAAPDASQIRQLQTTTWGALKVGR